MGKDEDDFLKGLGTLALIGGGLWLLKEIFGKKDVKYYRCWNCQKLIMPFTNPCPFCGVGIDWSVPDLNKDHSTGTEGFV